VLRRYPVATDPPGARFRPAGHWPMETITEEHPTVAPDSGAATATAAASEGLAPRRSTLRAAVAAMRPKEWIKNVLVFAGLLFSGKVDQLGAVGTATLAFTAFCAVSSAGYLVNDLIDVELDRKHPKKRLRPIAAGELAERAAIGLAVALGAGALALAFAALGWEVGLMVAGYGAAQLAYSFGLKQIVIVDVMVIAGLFILRVVAGAEAVDVHASEWLILCTGMLACFLGFTKRRQEAVSELHQGTDSRPVLEHYSLPFLDQMVAMVTAATVMSYAIYAVNSPLIGSKMLATLPPVLYGIFRYLYLIYDRKDTRSTDAIILEDYGMIGAGVTWVASVVILLAIYH
jgi:4-hydroxybenzoate polyprenyltransferase